MSLRRHLYMFLGRFLASLARIYCLTCYFSNCSSLCKDLQVIVMATNLQAFFAIDGVIGRFVLCSRFSLDEARSHENVGSLFWIDIFLENFVSFSDVHPIESHQPKGHLLIPSQNRHLGVYIKQANGFFLVDSRLKTPKENSIKWIRV